MGKDLVVDGSLEEDLAIEAVSRISNFVITGGGRLGKDLVIDWRLGEDSVIEAVSEISNLTPL